MMKSSMPRKLTLAACLCCAVAAFAQPSPVNAQDFSAVSALGDSLTDTPEERGPNHAERIAEMLGVDLTNYAVTGATTTTLLSGNQHTSAVAGNTTFAFLWIGGNDILFDNWMMTLAGDTSFIDASITNWTTAADALLDSGADVITANLPDLSGIPLAGLAGEEGLANIRATTIAFNDALQVEADARGIPVVDVFTLFTGLLSDNSTICGNAIGLPPGFGDEGDLFFDEIHPSSYGMGHVTNAFIEVMNEEYSLDLVPLSEEELASLAGFECIDDADNDGVPNSEDVCPGEDDNIDTDNDETPDCLDECPDDPNKTESGDCGCGNADIDTDEDGTLDCLDECPDDPNKTEAGECGCGNADVDTDEDGTLDCLDECPDDPNKTDAGDCGCGHEEVDSDNDQVSDCIDNCPNIANTNQADVDNDGIGDACDTVEPAPSMGFCGMGMIGVLPFMVLGLGAMKRRLH